ncbi:hypothetical protein HNQ09_002850 [Deinococcus budaensis]|uniref:TniQ domain-containing protein n=2 Tax=Deinococcus budaensis TaxID=1665626 RepID=A0A7W8GHS0_9DEIO|nr:hypothetical protein [Deinococcus budaensis]
MTLDALESKLRRPSGNRVGRRWVLPLKFQYRRVHAFGMQCCPDCLAEDEMPYYRRAWRLAFMTVCPRHKRLLLDQCPACESPIHYRATPAATRGPDADPASLASCGWCGLDFRDLSFGQYDERSLTLERGDYHFSRQSPRFRRPLISKIRRDAHFQGRLLEAVSGGDYVLNGTPLAVRELMEGLFQLTRLLMHLPGAEAWRRALHELADDMRLCGVESDRAILQFEVLRVEERDRIMTPLAWLLNDWPARFHKVSEGAGVGRQQLLKNARPVPTWLKQEVARYSRLEGYDHLRPHINGTKEGARR